jgi:hypothetical protein
MENERQTPSYSLQESVTVASSSTAAEEHGESFQKNESGREISEPSNNDQ